MNRARGYEGDALDVGRRVVQCSCGLARPWAGYRWALERGWRARYRPGRDGDLVRFWTCADCYTPPAPAPAQRPPDYTLPAPLARRILNGREGLAVDLVRLLEGLVAADPPRFEAYMRALVAELRDRKGHTAKDWIAFAEQRGVAAPKRPRRARAARAAERP